MKGAFDRIDRKKIWEALEEMEISENLMERIREIYEETSFVVRIKKKSSKQIHPNKGVRGCLV